MDRVEYYSGEAAASPAFADPMDDSAQFAINAKDIYNYNPASRPQQQMYMQQQTPFMNPPQQQMVYNTGYGYNAYPQQQYGVPMNTPTMNVQQYQSSIQTMNPMQINTGYVGNPAFGLLNQWQQQGTPYNPYQQQNSWYNPYTQQVVQVQQQPVYDQTVVVPGFNPSGTVGMLTSDAQEICEQMQVDMMLEQQAVIAKRQQRAQGYFFNNQYGYNYYGSPYMSYYDNSVYQKYVNKIQEMKQEAIDRRVNLNKRLSMICHNYLNDGMSEADINKIYEGYSYVIPGKSVQEYQTQEKLKRLVPFNNAWMYQQHSAEVRKLYQMIAPPGHNMNEFFQDAGMFFTLEQLEKEYHRRRNTQNYYDTDIYHEYLRKYAIEHEIEYKDKQHTREVANKLADLAISKNGNVTKMDIINTIYSPQQLEEMRKKGFVINPDGSLELNAHLPEKQAIAFENEMDYEMRRSAFIASIYNNSNSRAGG